MTPDGVDFVDKYDARRGLFTLLKHVADACCADTHKHLNKIRAADGKERNVRLAGNCAREKRFTGTRRPDHQHTFWHANHELLKFFRVPQKLHKLLYFIFCSLDPGDVAKCDLVFAAG